MTRLLCLAMVACMGCTTSTSPSQDAALVHHKAFPSSAIDARNVEVFLPKQYYEQTNARFNVVYMHDGQNVFNDSTSYGGIAWEIDSTVQSMMDQDQLAPTIVVGVWNNGMKRYTEYCPEKPFRALSPLVRDSIATEYSLDPEMLADEYLSFLVNELKPFIDAHYRTLPDAEHTFIMGSSMGGLISCYALLEHPDVFGGAACLSTHWPFSHQPPPHPFAWEMLHYVEENLPMLTTQKMYFDHGTATLDSLYAPYQIIVDSISKSFGFPASNYVSYNFQNEAHTEFYWKKRAHIPLSFLLGNK